MRYRCIKQYDSKDCALACLASVSWFFGKKVTLSQVKRLVEVSGEGVSIWDLCVAASRMGINANAFKCNERFNEEELSFPCIAHVYQEDDLSHFVIVYALNRKEVIIGDPVIGIIKVNRKDFFSSIYTDNSPYIWTRNLILLEITEQFQKNKKEKSGANKWILELLRTEGRKVVITVLLSLFSMTLSIVSTFYFQIIIDSIIPDGLYYTLFFYTCVMSGFIVLKVVFDWTRAKNVLEISRSFSSKLSLEYYRHVLELPISFFENYKSGEIIARFQDVNQLLEALITGILLLPVDLILVIVVGVVLATKSMKLFGIVEIMCALYVLVIMLFKNRYEVLNALKMAESGRVTTCYVDSVEGVQTIKCNTCADEIYESGKYRVTKLLQIIVNLGILENWQAAIKAIINEQGGILILFCGAIIIMKEGLSVGELVTYNLLVGYLLRPIADMVNLQSLVQEAMVSMERLKNILEIERETVNIKSNDELKDISEIEFVNADFGFLEDTLVLEKINIKLSKGEKLALVGKNGSGKTTLAKLMVGFYNLKSGNIYVNGKRINSFEKDCIRQAIVYVSQEEFIFTRSVRDNLLMGSQNVNAEQMIEMAIRFGVDDFVKNMSNKYDTILKERGANLSKGQQQKIAITRAVLKKPRVLILDEATSNIDNESERKILNYLRGDKELMLIMISHNMSNVSACDTICVMSYGRIVKQGTHLELMDNCVLYRKMYMEESV